MLAPSLKPSCQTREAAAAPPLLTGGSSLSEESKALWALCLEHSQCPAPYPACSSVLTLCLQHAPVEPRVAYGLVVSHDPQVWVLPTSSQGREVTQCV